MNLHMFKKIIREANPGIRVDFSFSNELIPNSIKLVKLGESFRLYKVEKDSTKSLIAEEPTETKLYKATLKYLNIKLNNSGRVIKQSPPKR